MSEALQIVFEIVTWLFLLYSALIFFIYGWIGIYAYGALKRYRNQNQDTDYTLIATDSNVPSFSIIAPAYNEGMTIVDNVRSLLSLYYRDLEIIIVNDGSKDDSIDKLIAAYDLQRIAYHVDQTIETKPIRGIYKSKNRAFQRLTVVDKVNGGKADALNVGINVSKGQYIVCIDVDCILEQDAILKLSKPFLDQTDDRVIACGGVIRLANNCKIENGKVVEVNLPKTWLGRFQALEYIRAFVLGRMAWSRASGLILISGAFGAFDKEIVLACGGYDSSTVGEDMELVVRMRRYMEEQKLKYKVINIPDPLCWTEVPESRTILKRQRNRWMRGTIETLWKHRKLMFNPRYGKLGMLSVPYWFFFEFLGPVVEFLGYCVFFIFLFLGIINWQFFIILLCLVLASGILYSIYAILVDLLTDQVYTKGKDLTTLLFTAVLEPLFFHTTVVLAGVAGVRDYFKKQHTWGDMTRQGFQQSAENQNFWSRIGAFVSWGLAHYAPVALMFIFLFLSGVLAEVLWYNSNFENPLSYTVIFNLATDNLIFALQIAAVIGVLYIIITNISAFFAKWLTIGVFSLVFTFQFILFLYFQESKNLLGADLFFYSRQEIQYILQTSGMISLVNVSLLLGVLFIGTFPLIWAEKHPFRKYYYGAAIMLLAAIASLVPLQNLKISNKTDVLTQNVSVGKWRYFLSSNLDTYIQENAFLRKYLGTDNSQDSLTEFSFMREEDTSDILGRYINPSAKTPNLVIIVLEGIGHAYSSPKGYIGNFMPFLDSLKSHSLYWENALSSSGRTFAVLPTLVGSLPFASHGFLEEPHYALHFNLWNVLKKNNFKTGFFYGGDSKFDFMHKYVDQSGVDQVVDIEEFPDYYKKLPAKNGESWGYEDQAVFSNMLRLNSEQSQPYFNLALTLSTHSPFLINSSEYYEKMVDKHAEQLKLAVEQRQLAQQYRKQLASVMNADDALRQFFQAYNKRADFSNTLFVITGDHSMPEIALQNKIDRYHVPLVVYSPLIKTPTTFKNTVSHFDIAPSLLSYYRNNYGLITPKKVAWIGRGLDPVAAKNSMGIPIMQSKYQLEDFVFPPYHLSGNVLMKLEDRLTEEAHQNDFVEQDIKMRFNLFIKKNKQFIQQQKLIPDSVYHDFFDR